jgi:hypothetical protein
MRFRLIYPLYDPAAEGRCGSAATGADKSSSSSGRKYANEPDCIELGEGKELWQFADTSEECARARDAKLMAEYNACAAASLEIFEKNLWLRNGKALASKALVGVAAQQQQQQQPLTMPGQGALLASARIRQQVQQQDMRNEQRALAAACCTSSTLVQQDAMRYEQREGEPDVEQQQRQPGMGGGGEAETQQRSPALDAHVNRYQRSPGGVGGGIGVGGEGGTGMCGVGPGSVKCCEFETGGAGALRVDGVTGGGGGWKGGGGSPATPPQIPRRNDEDVRREWLGADERRRKSLRCCSR